MTPSTSDVRNPQHALVRARVKTVEHMPEWTKCCEEGLRIINEAQGREMVVDTSMTVVLGCFCKKCGGGQERTVGVLIVEGRKGLGNLVPLEWLDLDEGQMEMSA